MVEVWLKYHFHPNNTPHTKAFMYVIPTFKGNNIQCMCVKYMLDMMISWEMEGYDKML